MLISKIRSLFLMLKSAIFKAFWVVLIFIQKDFSKTPMYLADEMPTSEGVRQGTSSQLVSRLFLPGEVSLYAAGRKDGRNEEDKKDYHRIC